MFERALEKPKESLEESVDSSFFTINGSKTERLSFRPEDLMETTQRIGSLALMHNAEQVSVTIDSEASEVVLTFPAD